MSVVLVLFFGLVIELFRLDLGLLVFDLTPAELIQPWWAVESKRSFFLCVNVCEETLFIGYCFDDELV